MSPLVSKTWAPTAQTPVLRERTRSRQKISAIGAIMVGPSRMRIRLAFRLHHGRNVGARACVDFLRQLKQNIPGPIVVIWDRLLAHRSKAVARFLHENPQIDVELLPAYAPDLNPVEYLWSYLKSKSLANHAPADFVELGVRAKRALCEIRRRRPLLRSFVEHAGLGDCLSQGEAQ